MELELVINKLKEFGTPQNRKIYKRHGAPDNMYGVSIANLKALKKQIRKNHNLARELWETQNTDAQCLATFIADPIKMEYDLAKKWAFDSTYYNLTDLLASNLLIKTSYAQVLSEELMRTENEYAERTGWKLLSLFALANNSLPDAYFLPYLMHIEQNIYDAKNRVREAMNTALISIGCRNDNLESIALKMTDAIGQVVVDHGQTSCKTPDAREYILKVKQRRMKQ